MKNATENLEQKEPKFICQRILTDFFWSKTEIFENNGFE